MRRFLHRVGGSAGIDRGTPGAAASLPPAPGAREAPHAFMASVSRTRRMISGAELGVAFDEVVTDAQAAVVGDANHVACKGLVGDGRSIMLPALRC
jgi:hypothetical protein